MTVSEYFKLQAKMSEWQCLDINSCLNCPYPDCIQGTQFQYPPKKRIIKVTELATGICREFDTIRSVNRALHIANSTILNMIRFGHAHNGYVAKRVAEGS